MAGVKQTHRVFLLLLVEVLIAQSIADFGDRISLNDQQVTTSLPEEDKPIIKNDSEYENYTEEPGDLSLGAPEGVETTSPSFLQVEASERRGKSREIAGATLLGARGPAWTSRRGSRPRPLYSRFRGREQTRYSSGRREVPSTKAKHENGAGKTPVSVPEAHSEERIQDARPAYGQGAAEETRTGESDIEASVPQNPSGETTDVERSEESDSGKHSETFRHENPIESTIQTTIKEKIEEIGGDAENFAPKRRVVFPKGPHFSRVPPSIQSINTRPPNPPADDLDQENFPAAIGVGDHERHAGHAPPFPKEKIESAASSSSGAKTKPAVKLTGAGQLPPKALTQRETGRNSSAVQSAAARDNDDNRQFEQTGLDRSRFETVSEPLASHRLHLMNRSAVVSNAELLLDSKIFNKVYSPFTLPSPPSAISGTLSENHNGNAPPMPSYKSREAIRENGTPFPIGGYTQIDHPKLRDYFQEKKHNANANQDASTDEKYHKSIYESTQDIIQRAALEERRKDLFESPANPTRPTGERTREGGRIRFRTTDNKNRPYSINPHSRTRNSDASFSFITVKRFSPSTTTEDAQAEDSTVVPVYSAPPSEDLLSSGSEINSQTSLFHKNDVDKGSFEIPESPRDSLGEVEGEVDTLISPLDQLLKEHGITDESFGKPPSSGRRRSRPRPTGYFGETEEDRRIIEEVRSGLDIQRQRVRNTDVRGDVREEDRNHSSDFDSANQQHRFDRADSPKFKEQPTKRENAVKPDDNIALEQQEFRLEQRLVPQRIAVGGVEATSSFNSLQDTRNQNLLQISHLPSSSEQNTRIQANNGDLESGTGLQPPPLLQFSNSQDKDIQSLLPLFRAPLPLHPQLSSREIPNIPSNNVPRPVRTLTPLPNVLATPQQPSKLQNTFQSDHSTSGSLQLPSTFLPPIPPPFSPPTEPPLDMLPPALIVRPTIPPNALSPPPTPEGHVELPALIETVPPFGSDSESENFVDSLFSGSRDSRNTNAVTQADNQRSQNGAHISFSKRPRIELNEFQDLIDFELGQTPQDNFSKGTISAPKQVIPQSRENPTLADVPNNTPFANQHIAPFVPPPPPRPPPKNLNIPHPTVGPGQGRLQVPLPRPALALTTRGTTFTPVHTRAPGNRLKITTPGGLRPPNEPKFLVTQQSLAREIRPTQKHMQHKINNNFRTSRPGGFPMKPPNEHLSPPPFIVGQGGKHSFGPLPFQNAPSPNENLFSTEAEKIEQKPKTGFQEALPSQNFNVRPAFISQPPRTPLPSSPPRVQLPLHALFPPPQGPPLFPPLQGPLPFNPHENISPLPSFRPSPPTFHRPTRGHSEGSPPPFVGEDFNRLPSNEHLREDPGFPDIPRAFGESFEFQGPDQRNPVRFPTGNELESDFVPVREVSQPLPLPFMPHGRMSESHAKMMKNLRFGVNGEPLDIWIPIHVTGGSRGPQTHQTDIDDHDYFDSFDSFESHDDYDYGIHPRRRSGDNSNDGDDKVVSDEVVPVPTTKSSRGRPFRGPRYDKKRIP